MEWFAVGARDAVATVMGQQQPDIFSDPHAGTPLRIDARRVMEAQEEDDPRFTDPHAGEPLRVNASKIVEHPHARTARLVGETVTGMWNVANPIEGAKAFGRMMIPEFVARGLGAGNEEASQYGLLNTAQNIAGAHVDTASRAVEDFQAGDYVTAARRALNALIPIIGPGIDASTDKIMQGDIAEGFGEVAATAGLTALGARPKAPPSPTRARPGRVPRNPAEAAAVQFAREEGIPLDAGTATGSQFVKNVQKKVSGSWGGASTAEAAQAAQGEALAAAADRLARRANDGGPAVTGVEAGEGVRSALQGRVRALHGQANEAYSRVREAESRAPEEFVQARPAKPNAAAVAAGVTPDHAFLARWLADDLREMSFEPGSRMGRSARLAEYEQATSMEEFRKSTYTPRIAGTPTQEMFHALGIKGTRKEIAAKLDRYMQTGKGDPKIATLLEAMRESWDGMQFNFDEISDTTIAKLGIRRRDLRSPLTTPFPDDMPEAYNRWFGQSNDLWEARQAARGERWEADPDDFTFSDDDTSTPPVKRFLPDEPIPEATGGAGAAADTEAMRFAIDLRPHREALRPLFDQLQKEREITGTLHGDKARAAVALEALINGPDYVPMTTLDRALGPIKKLASGADMPQLRTQGQGVAARVAGELDTAVRGRAQAAGPEVAGALAAGRAATRSKHLTAEVMKRIAPDSREPRAIFDALARNKDAGITKLRDVQKHVPDQMPNVARALLEDVFDKPTSAGGFKFADAAWARWQKIGPQTKAMLFPDRGHRMALDNFFLLAKKIGENPNPSGTAQTMNATGIIAGIPSYALAKLLYTPAGVRAITGVMDLSVRRPSARAARAAAVAQLSRAAQEAGVTLELPKAADTQPQGRESR